MRNIKFSDKQFITYSLIGFLGLVLAALIFIASDAGEKWIQALAGAIFIFPFFCLTKMKSKSLLIGLAFVIVFNFDIFIFHDLFYTKLGALGVPGLQISASHLLLAMLYVIWVLEGYPKPRANFSIVMLAILFFVICISNLVATYPIVSVLETYRIFFIVLMSYYVYSNIKDKDFIILLSYILIATIPIEAILAVSQYFGFFTSSTSIFGEMGSIQAEMGWSEITRPTGTFIHPNKFAMYLTLVIPLSISALVTTKKIPLRMFISCAVLLGFLALILSRARAAWIGVGFGLSILFFLLFRFSTIQHKVLRIYLFLFLIVAVATPIFLIPRFVLSDMGSAKSRIPMAETAVSIIRNNPVFGIGPNNYSLESWKYASESLNKAMISYPPHNIYLLVAAESGLPALVIFIIFCTFIVLTGLKGSTKSDLEINSIKYGITAGIIAFLIASLFNGHYLGEEVLFFFLSQYVIACENVHIYSNSLLINHAE